MREILFRAKTTDEVRGFKFAPNGTWVYGFYADKVGLPVIYQFEQSRADYVDYEVDRKTVGQYTELNDKNDKPIYEGDIITCVNKSRLSGYPIGKKMYGFIAYDDNYGFWFCKNNFQHYIDWSWADDIEVIGNIYDNPELLRGEK